MDVRLLTWSSPAFPIGAFAHSGGLEASVARAIVHDGTSLSDWFLAQMTGGAIRTDAIAVSLACRSPDEDIAQLDELVLALAGSPARTEELTALGRAFVKASEPWWNGAWPANAPRPRSYPVAFGRLAGLSSLDAGAACVAFVHGTLVNGVQAAQRLLPLGQAGAMRIVRDLEGDIEALTREADAATLDDWGTATLAVDLASLTHATIEPRLFRS